MENSLIKLSIGYKGSSPNQMKLDNNCADRTKVPSKTTVKRKSVIKKLRVMARDKYAVVISLFLLLNGITNPPYSFDEFGFARRFLHFFS